jgi:hypothetical protein
MGSTSGCEVEPLENVLRDGNRESAFHQVKALTQEIADSFQRTEAKGSDHIVLGNGWWSERHDQPIEGTHTASLYHRKGQITFEHDHHSYSCGMTVKAHFPKGTLSISADLPSDGEASAMQVAYGIRFGKKEIRSLVERTPGREVHTWFWEGLGLSLREAKLVLGPCYSRPKVYEIDEVLASVLNEHFEYTRILQNHWNNEESIEFGETIQIDCLDPYSPDGYGEPVTKATIESISILAHARLDLRQESHLRRHPLLLGLWEYVTGLE